MKILGLMFSRKWFLTTVLVVAGSVLCVRLGIWQLDRLRQRRVFNAHYLAVRKEAPLDVNFASVQELSTSEYRDTVASGTYDFANQVALRNQYNGNEYGYHLLTPLLIADGTAVLVDRGWIPADGNTAPSDWRKYDVPGQVKVKGILRLGETQAEIGGVPDPTLTPGQTRLDVWNLVNLDRIGQQLPYRLLPAFIQPNPDPADTVPPIPYQAEVDISEGPHLGYAGQWFTFAALLFFGYPIFYLRKQAGRS